MLLDETIRDKQSNEDDNGETCSSSSTEVQGTLNLTPFADLSTTLILYIDGQRHFIVTHLIIFTAGSLFST